MVARVEIAGQHFPLIGYTVSEDSTPLAAGDSSGSTGTITFSITEADHDLRPGTALDLNNPAVLLGHEVKLWDNFKGYTIGRVSSVSRAQDTGILQVQAFSVLNDLNVYHVKAQPIGDTVANVIEYYKSLSRTPLQVLVLDSAERALSSELCVIPGWEGELWFHLKQFAYSIDADISLVSGIIILRPIRERVATRGRDIQRSVSFGGGQLAQRVEVYNYQNRVIIDELVYPPPGWSDEVTVITVNAGETVEQVLELSASVTSIQQPTFQTFVSKAHDSTSVFTVVGDDGMPITKSAWGGAGGSLKVEIGKDTKTLNLVVTAPTGIPNVDKDGFIETYSLALSDEASTGRYSTLRIIGTGVAFDRQVLCIPTGVSAFETGTEVGATVDNPFLGTREQAIRAGLRAVRGYNGSGLTVNGSIVAINQRGDSGVIAGRTVAYVQGLFQGGKVSDVQAEWGSFTNADIMGMLNNPLEDEFENQVFGNVNGVRVWDQYSRRWYRVRSGTLVADGISFEAEDDLVHDDLVDFFIGKSYSLVQSRFSGMTYRQVDALGVPA